MINHKCLWVISLAVFSVLAVSAALGGQETTGMQPGQNVAEMKFETPPGFPTCAKASVQNGDPEKGPSILLAKVATRCTIPWHWHTPNESVMMVSGNGRMDMKDGKPMALEAGGFVMMPSRHVHQFHCNSDCTLFVYSDTVFDINYVNEQGEVIEPADALKAVNETVAAEMKK